MGIIQEAAMTTLCCSEHAAARKVLRNLSDQDLSFVLTYGRRHRCAGALHIFLGWRDLPQDRDIYRQYAHLEGTTLVIDDTGGRALLITVYRNRRAWHQLRRKTKYDRSSCKRG